jgi:deoxyribose-phosphate aldolase
MTERGPKSPQLVSALEGRRMIEDDEVENMVEEIASRLRRRLAARPREAPADSAAPRPPTAPLAPGQIRTPADLAPYIDHTLLSQSATREEVERLAEEALKYAFAGVCVNSAHVETAARILAGSRTLPIAVVGFPLGAALPEAKAFEARAAIRGGAREIDMVIDLGALKAKDYARVLADLRAVVQAAAPHPVKAILEVGQLGSDEKIAGCVVAKAAGAAFVKTSTGFFGGGATADDVALMRRIVGHDVGVKASGGIRSAADALRLIEAGANRIGASASVAIITGGTSTSKY